MSDVCRADGHSPCGQAVWDRPHSHRGEAPRIELTRTIGLWKERTRAAQERTCRQAGARRTDASRRRIFQSSQGQISSPDLVNWTLGSASPWFGRHERPLRSPPEGAIMLRLRRKGVAGARTGVPGIQQSQHWSPTGLTAKWRREGRPRVRKIRHAANSRLCKRFNTLSESPL